MDESIINNGDMLIQHITSSEDPAINNVEDDLFVSDVLKPQPQQGSNQFVENYTLPKDLCLDGKPIIKQCKWENEDEDCDMSELPVNDDSGLESRYHNMFWRRCDQMDISASQKVEAKEKAVADGLRFLSKLSTSLKTSLNNMPIAQRWLHRIDDINKSKRDCQLLIGFVGTTGAGKSSLIKSVFLIVLLLQN